jgi:hypothetical protein
MNNATVLKTCLGRDTTMVLSLLLVCSSAFAQEALISRLAVPSSIESFGPHLKKQPTGGLETVQLNQSQDAMHELPISSIQKLSGERSMDAVACLRIKGVFQISK